MNHKVFILAALTAASFPMISLAQAPAAADPATPAVAATPPAQPAAVASTAYPAKIALVAFEQAVYATNEGQRAVEDVRKKFQPQKDKMDALAAEIDTLKKQLQSAPATLSEADRAAKLKTIDGKDKQYQRDAEDAQTAYNAELQDALGKVAQKVNAVMINYVEKNGYTLLLNVGNQQSQVMWTSPNPNADITEAVIAAYNATTPSVSAPPPAAPSPTAKPRTTAPATHTPAKPPAK